jgi:hypothetical protein
MVAPGAARWGLSGFSEQYAWQCRIVALKYLAIDPTAATRFAPACAGQAAAETIARPLAGAMPGQLDRNEIPDSPPPDATAASALCIAFTSGTALITGVLT